MIIDFETIDAFQNKELVTTDLNEIILQKCFDRRTDYFALIRGTRYRITKSVYNSLYYLKTKDEITERVENNRTEEEE